MNVLQKIPGLLMLVNGMFLFFLVIFVLGLLGLLKSSKWSVKAMTLKQKFKLISVVLIIVCIIYVEVIMAKKLIHLNNIGWSFWNKSVSVEIQNDSYQQALDCYNEMDYLNAEDLFKSALDDVGEQNGDGSPEVALVKQKLGALYAEMGRYDEAIECYTDSYVAFQNHYGDNDGNTILSKGRLAVCDILQGDVEQGFASLNELYDETDYYQYKLQIAQMLAQCETKLGNYNRALEWYEVLGNLFTQFDIQNLQTVNLINDYGVFEANVGNDKEAREAFEGAVEKWNELNLDEDSTIANVCQNLAYEYATLGMTDEAIEMSNKALSIEKKLFGEGNVYEASSYLTLSDTYGALGDNEKQLGYINKALSIALSSVGENHMMTASVYSSMGLYYKETGDIPSAIESYLKSLEIQKNILGTKSTLTIGTYESLSELCRHNQDIENGIAYANEAIELSEGLFGSENLNTAHSYITAAWSYADAGDIAKAEELADSALNYFDQYSENLDAMLAYANETKGYVYYKTADYGQAAEYYEKAILLYDDSGMADSESMMNAYILLGEAYSQGGNFSEAANSLKKAYSIAKDRYVNKTLPKTLTSRLQYVYETLEITIPYEEWLETGSQE